MLNSPADLTVDYQEGWVTRPDPLVGQDLPQVTQPAAPSGERHLATLVTCKEFFSTPYRSIGFAELTGVQTKA